MEVYKPCHYDMVEAVEPFKLYSTSNHMHLRCWSTFICLWLHTHTVTTTDISPDLGELAETLGDGSVQTIMPLGYS
jgi:hypothetical protein